MPTLTTQQIEELERLYATARGPTPSSHAEERIIGDAEYYLVGQIPALLASARREARLEEALQDISNHGTDLPAALNCSDEFSDGYRKGLMSCGGIARAALAEGGGE